MKKNSNKIIVIIVILILIGSGIYIWDEFIKYRVIPKRWGVVENEAIYRSGQLSAALIQRTLSKHNIKVIVDLTSELPNDTDQNAERKAAQQLDIQLKRFPLKGDGTGDIKNYANAINAIVEAKKQGKPVLVHCAAGTQRTGGVIACYRMLIEKQTPAFAYNELLKYNWHDKPDQVLLKYINTNMDTLTQLLFQMGVIEEIPEPLPVIKSKYDKEKISLDNDKKRIFNENFAYFYTLHKFKKFTLFSLHGYILI